MIREDLKAHAEAAIAAFWKQKDQLLQFVRDHEHDSDNDEVEVGIDVVNEVWMVYWNKDEQKFTHILLMERTEMPTGIRYWVELRIDLPDEVQ